MSPLVLLGLLFLVLAACLIRRLLPMDEDEIIDVCPDMSVSDILLGLTAGSFIIIIIGGCVVTASYVMGYY